MCRDSHASFVLAGTYNKLQYGLNDNMYLEFIHERDKSVLTIKIVRTS